MYTYQSIALELITPNRWQFLIGKTLAFKKLCLLGPLFHGAGVCRMGENAFTSGIHGRATRPTLNDSTQALSPLCELAKLDDYSEVFTHVLDDHVIASQEFYALRAQQQQRQGTKLLHDSASSSGEEEDPSTHFRTRAGGPGPSLSHGAPGGLGGGTSNRGPGVGSRAASSQAGSSSSSATTAAALSRRRGGVGGAGRSLAALAMQDGEDDMAAEDHHQQQQQQQQQQGPPEGMAEVDATASGRQGLGGADGDGPGDAEQSQPADGHPTKSGGEAGRRVEDAGQRGDLLSDALASVQASKDKAAQPSTAKPPALKPQIKVMAKPKAAPAPVLPAAKESSQDDGPSGLGLLGSYGSSSSGSEDDAK
eukprot:1141539-Pelagomonas_calceolata.AAC.1